MTYNHLEEGRRTC